MSYVIIASIIGFVILAHEYGHLLAARFAGIPIQRFSIGFGPKLWSWTRGGTEYRLSLVPLGGYVLPAMADEKQFFLIAPEKRILFSAGGIAANLILAAALYGAINAFRQGFSLQGIFIDPFIQTGKYLALMFFSLGQVVTSPEKLSGVVGIVSQGSRYAGLDPVRIMTFTALISVNLAVINLLPIPALDGGKIVLYSLEKIHPRMSRLHYPLSLAAWALLIALMVYVTVMDIGRLV